jgi:hypothetical protein
VCCCSVIVLRHQCEDYVSFINYLSAMHSDPQLCVVYLGVRLTNDEWFSSRHRSVLPIGGKCDITLVAPVAATPGASCMN